MLTALKRLLAPTCVLVLATPTDTGLTVHAKANVLGARAWTAPTLSGTTLYVRDLKQIVALDLTK